LLIKTISISCYKSSNGEYNTNTWLDGKDSRFSNQINALNITNKSNLKPGQRGFFSLEPSLMSSLNHSSLQAESKHLAGYILFFNHFLDNENKLQIAVESDDPGISNIEHENYSYLLNENNSSSEKSTATCIVVECDEDLSRKLKFGLIITNTVTDEKSMYCEGSMILDSHTDRLDNFTAKFEISYGVCQSPDFLSYIRFNSDKEILGIGEILRDPTKFEEYKQAYLAYKKKSKTV
jgi:hypothetical protein